MLWVKAFHIIFVASWFAGLFYLPRIFVNLAMVPPDSVAERERLLLMAQKLMRFMTILLGYGIGGNPPADWMSLKLAVVVLTLGYHHLCMRHLKHFESGEASHSHVWYRWFNEAPVLLMVAAVLLVVIKPF
jgi:putative membrane protein